MVYSIICTQQNPQYLDNENTWSSSALESGISEFTPWVCHRLSSTFVRRGPRPRMCICEMWEQWGKAPTTAVVSLCGRRTVKNSLTYKVPSIKILPVRLSREVTHTRTEPTELRENTRLRITCKPASKKTFTELVKCTEIVFHTWYLRKQETIKCLFQRRAVTQLRN